MSVLLTFQMFPGAPEDEAEEDSPAEEDEQPSSWTTLALEGEGITSDGLLWETDVGGYQVSIYSFKCVSFPTNICQVM